MSNDFICCVCEEEPKLACRCNDTTRLFCALHFASHLENQTIPHTPLTLTQYKSTSSLAHSKAFNKLEKVSIKLSEYQSQISTQLLNISNLEESVHHAIRQIFSQESERYSQVLSEIKARKNFIESCQHSYSSDADLLLGKYKSSKLPGLLPSYVPIKPLNLYSIISQLLKAFNLNQDELLSHFNQSSNVLQAEEYKEQLVAKEVEITQLRQEIDTVLRLTTESNLPSNILPPPSLKTFEEYKETAVLTGHTDRIFTLAITPDGLYAASGSSDNTIKIWNLRSEQLEATLQGHTLPLICLRTVPNSTILISSSHDRTIRIWDMATHTNLGVLRGHEDSVSALAVSRDGSMIVSGGYDGMIRIWNLRDRSIINSIRLRDCFLCLEISVDSKYIFAGFNSKTCLMFKLDTLQVCGRFIGSRGYSCISAMNNGKYIVTVGDSAVRIWNIEDQSELAQLIGHTSWIESICISSDDRYIISASNDRTIKVWSLQDRALLATLTGHTERVCDVKISRDGKCLVSCSEDRSVRIWRRSISS
jgi:WD40 repeat protein